MQCVKLFLDHGFIVQIRTRRLDDEIVQLSLIFSGTKPLPRDILRHLQVEWHHEWRHDVRCVPSVVRRAVTPSLPVTKDEMMPLSIIFQRHCAVIMFLTLVKSSAGSININIMTSGRPAERDIPGGTQKVCKPPSFITPSTKFKKNPFTDTSSSTFSMQWWSLKISPRLKQVAKLYILQRWY